MINCLNSRNLELIDQYFRDKGISRNATFDPWTERLSFKQFVELVATQYENGFVDQHWIPISDRCDPCGIKYDFILRLETLDEDTAGFYKYLNRFQNTSNKIVQKKNNRLDFATLKERSTVIRKTFKNTDNKIMVEKYIFKRFHAFWL